MAYNVPLSSLNASDGNINYTQTAVVRVGSGGNITVSQGLFESNGQVGIGTTVYNTAAKLQVQGNVFVTNGSAWFGNLSIVNTTPSTTSSTGALVVAGGIAAGNGIIISGNVGIGTSGPQAQLHIGNATASNAHIIFDGGVLLTNQEIGAMEYDGNVWYQTDNLTGGRGVIPHTQQFRLQSARAAVGSATIPAAFFGPGANVGVLANSTYEFEYNLYFTKTTNGTVTFRMEEAAAPVNLNATFYISNAVAGGGTTSVTDTVSLFNNTSAASAFPVTKTLTTGLNYFALVKGIVDTNATTGGNIFISYLASAGTVTPLRGSYFKITRLPTGNVGTFT